MKYTNKLIDYCKNGNLNELKELVENHSVDLNSVDLWGFPPVYYAVMEGHLDVVSYLISQNVNLNVSIPILLPGAMEHTLLEDCLINHKKSWPDKLKMAKLLLDNGYNKNHRIENGLEHILDIAIMFIQKSNNFELLKFLLKNFENVNIRLQILDKPIPLEVSRKQGMASFTSKTNPSRLSLISIYNVSSSIPRVFDKLIEALDESILENELKEVPVMIFRLAAKLDKLDTLIEIILNKCNNCNYFQKRRCKSLKNNTNLKIDVLSGIQEKLEKVLHTDVDTQLIAYDNQILELVHHKIMYIQSLSEELNSKKAATTPRISNLKNILGGHETFSDTLILKDTLKLQFLSNKPIKLPVLKNTPEQPKAQETPLQVGTNGDFNLNGKNILTYTIGTVFLVPIIVYSVHKYVNFMKKLLRKKSNKDRLIHAIQHDISNVENKLVNRLPDNAINKHNNCDYSLINYAFSKNNKLNLMKTLIDKDTNTSIVDSCKKNLLMQSIEKKSVPLSMYFIDKVDLAAKDTLGKDSLIYAIENNMPTVAYNIICKLLEQKLNLFTCDSYGKNTLVYSIKYNLNTITNILVDNLPYDINKRDIYGHTLLDYAFSKNNLDLIKTLVAKGANTSIVDSCKKNLLMQSIEKKSVPLSMYFMDKVDLASKDALGKDSLIYAIENNMPTVAYNIFDNLIKLSLSPCTRDSYGKNTLMYSIEHQMDNISSTLLYYITADTVNESDNKGYTPFDYAYVNNNKKIIVELLKKGFKITDTSSHRHNFVKLIKKSCSTLDTCDRDLLDIVSVKFPTIMEDIIRNMDSENVLMYCCKNNLNSILDILLKKRNIVIDAADNNNETALYYAIKNNNTKIAKYLLRHGANINIKDKNNKTPLMFAIENKNITIINELLLRGDDIFAKDKYRKSVLDYATASDNTEIKNIIQTATLNNKIIHTVKHKTSKTTIKKYSKPTSTPINSKSISDVLINASETNNLSMVIKLLTPANVDTCDESGKTCLMYACENGSLRVADYLIRNNASLNKLDLDGNSALYYACKNNHIELVKKLLQNGIHIGLEKPDSGLLSACENGYLDIVKLLVENKMPIDPIYNIKSPLMYACENGQLDVAKYLVNCGARLDLVLERNECTVVDFAKKSKNPIMIQYIQDKCTTKTRRKINSISKEKSHNTTHDYTKTLSKP